MADSERFRALTREWFLESCRHRYSYGFSWLGRPIIQYPQDLLALQEIIWRVQPNLIVETGVAHGGALVFYASMLELLGGDRLAVGVDVEVRSHNREAIEAHPLSRRMHLIEGSSVDDSVATQVHELARNRGPVMVCLDSNHTHDHVLRELQIYAPLVGKDSYLVVLDTVVEDMPSAEFFADRPWSQGNNPKTAVDEFLKTCDRFEVDSEIERRLMITVAPGGYLRCVKD